MRKLNGPLRSASFGVAAFCKKESLHNFRGFHAVKVAENNPVNKCVGSGAVIAELTSGKAVFGVHLPLDFRTEGQNNCIDAVGNLIKLMNVYIHGAYAIGDMNTVPEIYERFVTSVESTEIWKMSKDVFTFFPSFFDFIPREITAVELVELN